MDWIKKNYDQFILALLALVLLACSALLISKALGFNETFASIKGEVPHNNTVKPVPTDDLQKAENALRNPPAWTKHEGSLFVSKKYLVKNGELVPIGGGAKGPQLHPPVPNQWFIDHKMEDAMLEDDILDQDPDGDGFSNLDEFLGKTDPMDKNSHPPYLTKLFLEQFIKKPFRLRFEAYDGDTFQINAVDVHSATQFLKIGDKIEGTKFVIKKFEHKTSKDANDVEHDVSELAVENTETHEEVILIPEKTIDSPDSYALFSYFWNYPNTHQKKEFQVKKKQDFAIEPEKDRQYKVIDITETEAVIQDLKSGQKIKIPQQPQNDANPIHVDLQ